MRKPTPATRLVTELPSAVQRAVQAVGMTFFLVGCLGFLPGFATDLEQIHLTGPGSSTALLGLVPVTVAGNLVHLTMAGGALLCRGSVTRARAYLAGGGLLYAVLCARSLVIGAGESAAAPHAGSAVWCALAAGVVMLTAGCLAVGPLAVTPARPGTSGSRA